MPELRRTLLDFHNHLLQHRSMEVKVDESGSGDFSAGDALGQVSICAQRIDDLLSDIARVAFERFGQLHRQIAGQFAMIVAARTAEFDRA
jgi:hypothetical protein